MGQAKARRDANRRQLAAGEKVEIDLGDRSTEKLSRLAYRAEGSALAAQQAVATANALEAQLREQVAEIADDNGFDAADERLKVDLDLRRGMIVIARREDAAPAAPASPQMAPAMPADPVDLPSRRRAKPRPTRVSHAEPVSEVG